MDSCAKCSPLPGHARPLENSHDDPARVEKQKETSYLAHIDVLPGCDPIALFLEWKALAAARGALMTNTMVISTVNRKMEVSSRTLVLRRMDGDAFVFMTDSRSRKAADLAEHPRASLVFQWNYREGARVVNRQVRAAGAVTPLPDDAFGDLYAREPLYCRLRSHLCHQGEPVDWTRHSARHDALLAQHRDGTAQLYQRPEHVVAYRLQPEWLEMYHALDDCIGDRVLFTRHASDGGWSFQHLAA
ncbi:hypothetical protein R5R35_013759 [Gryllus longicercus]|uniref:pyridoxal 5'-phosphate synthase n=1 Tax=Gryllus longicercus TaxID=2509291 RepID=A0AAN9WIQ8_9ORTH